MKKGIVGVLIILIAWFGFSVLGGSEEEVETTPVVAMGEKTKEVADGSYIVDSLQSEFVWIGRKNLLKDYVDSGTVVVSEGEVSFVEGLLATGSFSIDLSTIGVESTGRGGGQSSLAQHLKSDAFFDVENHPTSTFTISKIVLGETDSLDDGYIVTGDLTIKGVTNEISFPADVYMQDEALHLDAEFSVDRTRWDIRYGSGSFFDDLGDQVIADEFEVAIMLVATQEEEEEN